jgi:hypothetical protein
MAQEYAHLKTNQNEYVKSYITYDASSRMEYIYEARAVARHGEPCLVTRYVYDGVSTRIVKMKEYEGTWDSSWDI